MDYIHAQEASLGPWPTQTLETGLSIGILNKYGQTHEYGVIEYTYSQNYGITDSWNYRTMYSRNHGFVESLKKVMDPCIQF